MSDQQMFIRLKRLLSAPPLENPRLELIEILQSSIEILAIPDNDFAWSSWGDCEAAIKEIAKIIEILLTDDLPPKLQLAVIFAPTGPFQEVSLSSGWADTFLKLAARFDLVEVILWPASEQGLKKFSGQWKQDDKDFQRVSLEELRLEERLQPAS